MSRIHFYLLFNYFSNLEKKIFYLLFFCLVEIRAKKIHHETFGNNYTATNPFFLFIIIIDINYYYYLIVRKSHVFTVIKCICRTGPSRKTNAPVPFIISGGKQNQNQPEKPFHCNVCDGTFSRYSSLWSHKRLHSGDKPFKCEVCNLAFAKGTY